MLQGYDKQFVILLWPLNSRYCKSGSVACHLTMSRLAQPRIDQKDLVSQGSASQCTLHHTKQPTRVVPQRLSGWQKTPENI